MESKVVITSKKFWLNSKDFLRSLVMAAGTAALQVIQTSLDSGHIPSNWKPTVIAALAGMGAYLIKNFFTPATIQKPVSNEVVEKSTLDTTAK